ncbi:MAG TPA: glycosyltransferase [Bacteroidales bacterium]|nr:glycosyltransferase [Bacteroidales bacterium]
MKIPIVMPTYNRPEFLRVVVDHLRVCDNIDKFKIYTSEEPGFPEVQKIFKSIDFMEIERHINDRRLDCNNNVLQAINIGFLNADFVVVLEDDVVPARDFLNLCIWADENFRNDSSIGCVTGFSLSREEKPDQEVAADVLKWQYFWPWGWATWKDRWEHPDNKEASDISKTGRNIHSWDINFSNVFFLKNGFHSLFPVIPRTRNIGVHGRYVPSQLWHEQNMQTLFFADDDENYFRSEFKLV